MSGGCSVSGRKGTWRWGPQDVKKLDWLRESYPFLSYACLA